MTAVYLTDLDWVGIDAFDRPVWKRASDGQHFCLVDTLLDDTPQARYQAMEALMLNPFTELYAKCGTREGEPSHPVTFRHRPAALRCVYAPQGQGMFSAGRTYELEPPIHTGVQPHDPRNAEVQDDLGHPRVIRLEPDLPRTFHTGVSAPGGRSFAVFEEVRHDD